MGERWVGGVGTDDWGMEDMVLEVWRSVVE